MRGDRDSELASVIRDTDMIDSKMAGKPYKVGRFAHTLRIRLMREHLGCDVDSMEEDDLLDRDAVAPEEEIQVWDPSHEQQAAGDHHDEGVVKTQTVGDRMWMHAASVAHSGELCLLSRPISSVADFLSLLSSQSLTVRPSPSNEPPRRSLRSSARHPTTLRIPLLPRTTISRFSTWRETEGTRTGRLRASVRRSSRR